MPTCLPQRPAAEPLPARVPASCCPGTRWTPPGFPAIDAHSHLGRWLSGWAGREGQWLVQDVESWLEAMSAFNVHGFVNLDGRWGEELRSNLARFDAALPGTHRHVLPRGLGPAVRAPGARDARGAPRRVRGGWRGGGQGLEGPRACRSATAMAGWSCRTTNGWRPCGRPPVTLGIPVWWHAADPVAFFDPVDEHNEYLELLASRPDWSFAGPDFPSFERLIDASRPSSPPTRARRSSAVHAGCCAENLGWVGRMLDSYPNFHIDIAARIAQLGRQPRAARAS